MAKDNARPDRNRRTSSGKRSDKPFREKGSKRPPRSEGGENKPSYQRPGKFAKKSGRSFGEDTRSARSSRPGTGPRFKSEESESFRGKGSKRPPRSEGQGNKPPFKRPGKFAKKSGRSFGEDTRPARSSRLGTSPRFKSEEGESFRGKGSKRPPRSEGERNTPSKRPGKPRFRSEEGSRDGDRPKRGSFAAKRTSSARPSRFDDSSSRKPRSGKPSKFPVDRTPPKDRDKRPRKSREEIFNEPAPVQTGQIRLNRYIANSGVCSRREADELITMGLISVNGKTVTEMGYKVNPGDVVRHEDKVLKAEKPVYILLNKPKGYLTTTSDPQERNTVMQLIANAVRERVYPVGRLDRNTTGLLLLTNDGDLADKLMHPSYNVKKIYKVELDRPLTKADFQKLQEGVQLEEGKAMIDDAAIVSEDGKTIGIEIHIGWNRVVRRIFESMDYQVVKLDRSVYAGLDKKDLPRGHWRFLRKEEVVRLKHYK